MRKKLVDNLWKSSNAFKKAVFTEEDGLPVWTDGAAAALAVILLILFMIVSSWA